MKLPHYRIQPLLVAVFALLLLMPYSTFLLQALRHALEVRGQGLSPRTELVLVGWKEVLLAVAALLILVRTVRHRQLPFRPTPLDWGMVGFLLYGVMVGGAISGSAKAVIFGIRYDFAVFFFYWIGRSLALDRERLLAVLRSVTVAALPMLVFGLLQVFVLPKEFLERFGYSWVMRVSGNPLPPYHLIGEKTMRAMSTFPGPNSLAMYAVFLCLALLWFGRSWFPRTVWLGLSAVAGLTLLTTFSRGHLFSFAAALLLSGILRTVWVASSPARRLAVSCAFVLSTLLLILYVSVRPPTLTGNGFVTSYLFHNSSSEVHRDVRLEAWERIVSHPFGTGLGTSGLATTNTGGAVFNPESWYVQITQELGWPGLGLALSVIGLTYWVLIRMLAQFPDPRDRNVAYFLLVSFTAIVLSAQFLPSWFEVASITWWVLFGIFYSDYERSFGVANRLRTIQASDTAENTTMARHNLRQ